MKVLNPTKTMNIIRLLARTQLSSAGQITITIENKDQFLHLHNSYLLIEGQVSKADNTTYADADLITLTNNGLLYLFSSLRLTLERINYPGQATSLLGLASYSSFILGDNADVLSGLAEYLPCRLLTKDSISSYCLLSAVPILEPQGAYGDAEKVSDPTD